MPSPLQARSKKDRSQETVAEAIQEAERMMRLAIIYQEALIFILAESDTVRRDGTAKTMERIFDAARQAFDSGMDVLAEGMTTDEQWSRPFCTDCATYLSEASQIAGYCLHCTFKN